MSLTRPQHPTRRRALLLGVAVLLTASALLAVAVLLIGRFGTVEGRILGTTTLLGGAGVLALPATMLMDLRRAPHLAAGLLALCAGAAVLFLLLLWQDDPPTALAKAAGTAAVVTVAVAQTAALVARRRPLDPSSVRGLLVASVVLAAAAAGLVTVAIWSDSGDTLGRVLGAVVVLDMLAAALQPILARARAAGARVRMRLTSASGAVEEVSADGRDPAAAVAAGIRRAEGEGGSVVAVEILERAVAPPG